MSEPKARSGNQSHNNNTVFNVSARLERVVPEIERLRDMAAKTNQQKQKRAELKKLSPHFIVSRGRIHLRKRTRHPTILVASP